MTIGVAVMYLATFLIPSGDVAAGMFLFPIALIFVGIFVFLAGYSKSPIELKVRGTADRAIKYIRDNWFKAAIENIIGTKRRWYIAGFLFPLIFTFLTFGLLGSLSLIHI